jgi:RND family efflux transporter MFP subunit
MSKPYLKILLPVGVIAGAVILFGGLVQLRPNVERAEAKPNYPKIETFTVEEKAFVLSIEAQGTVQPRQRTRLTARVSGQIEWVSPSFYEGGAFKKGDVLLKLDPLPYQSALAESRSRLALAKSVFLQEQEAANQARRDWESVGSGSPGDLVLRIPQMEKAKADLRAAEVGVEMAERNLDYTEIRAPYSGRVDSKLVDVGQAIAGQASILGEIFSIDAMEIPLAISLDDLALVERGGDEKPVVLLQSEVSGNWHTWNAYLDRTAASINQRSRMISAYARMNPPFLSEKGELLRPGMFVMANIQGKQLDRAIRIPREAIHPGNVVYRLTDGNRLESVRVDVIRSSSDWAYCENSLNDGDSLCLTPLLFFVNGMIVEPSTMEAPDNTESEQAS